MANASKRSVQTILELLEQSPTKWYTRNELKLLTGYCSSLLHQSLKQLKDSKQIAYFLENHRFYYKKYEPGDPQNDSSGVEEKILDALSEGCTTSKELIDCTGISGSYVQNCLISLMDKKLIDRSENKNSTGFYEYSIASKPKPATTQSENITPIKTPLLSDSERNYALQNPAWAEQYNRLMASNPHDPEIGDRYLRYGCLYPPAKEGRQRYRARKTA